MKKELIGILICSLFLIAGLASVINAQEINSEEEIEESIGRRLFVFGRMEQIDFYGGSIDFVVTSFVYIKDGKDITKLNNGETLRLFAPMIGILFNKMVIGFFSDWAIIE